MSRKWHWLSWNADTDGLSRRSVRIFLAGTSLQPSYGGPAYSVARLAAALAEAGAEVGLWASDQSALSVPLLNTHGSIRVLEGNAAEALEKFGNIDVLHDNGIWLPHNHRLAVSAAQRRIPRVVSTRGMLEPWVPRRTDWDLQLQLRLR